MIWRIVDSWVIFCVPQQKWRTHCHMPIECIDDEQVMIWRTRKRIASTSCSQCFFNNFFNQLKEATWESESLHFVLYCNFDLFHSFPLFLAASYPNTGSHGARIHVCARCKTVVIGWSMAASAGSPTVWRPVSLSSSPMPIPVKDIEALTKMIKRCSKVLKSTMVGQLCRNLIAEQFRLQASQRLWWTRITKVYRSARRLTRVIRKTWFIYVDAIFISFHSIFMSVSDFTW